MIEHQFNLIITDAEPYEISSSYMWLNNPSADELYALLLLAMNQDVDDIVIQIPKE